jgi:hypothetical protein
METLEELEAQLAAAEKHYQSMKGGCGCNKAGRERNAAKKEYLRNTLEPLRRRVKQLKTH